MVISVKLTTFVALFKNAKRKLGIISQYNVSLASIPEGKVERVFVCRQEFFQAMENSEVLDSDVEVQLEIIHKNSAYNCLIKLNGEIKVACDRCLEPMRHAVNTEYRITIKYGYEYDDSSDEILILPEEEVNFNFASMIHDTIVLTLPIRRVHKKGECNPEMEAKINNHSAILDDEESFDEEEM